MTTPPASTPDAAPAPAPGVDPVAMAMGVSFAVIWSSAFTSAKILVTDLPPFYVSSLRFAIAGCIACGIVWCLLLYWTNRGLVAQWKAGQLPDGTVDPAAATRLPLTNLDANNLLRMSTAAVAAALTDGDTTRATALIGALKAHVGRSERVRRAK